MRKFISILLVAILTLSLSAAVYAETPEEDVPSLGLVSSEENRITDPVMIERLEAGLNPITGEPFSRTKASDINLADGAYSGSVSSFPSTSPLFIPKANTTIKLKIKKSADTNLTVYWKVRGLDTKDWYTQTVTTTLFYRTHSLWEKGTSDTGWDNFYITFNSSSVSSFDYEVFH